MQSLDVISVNFWQIVISLANLTILFLILKKLLFKPVQNVLEQRQKTLDTKYEAAEKSVAEAEETKKAWEEKLRSAEEKADSIIKEASEDAKNHSNRIVAEARSNAECFVSVRLRMRQNLNAAVLKKASREKSLTFLLLLPRKFSAKKSVCRITVL